MQMEDTVAFPKQQWLRQHATMLHDIIIVYIFFHCGPVTVDRGFGVNECQWTERN